MCVCGMWYASVRSKEAQVLFFFSLEFSHGGGGRIGSWLLCETSNAKEVRVGGKRRLVVGAATADEKNPGVVNGS